MMQNLIKNAHPQWHPILLEALAEMDDDYLRLLQDSPDWLPGQDKLFASFSLALSDTRYILLGESPYPRAQSANGYAFWDNSVGSLWSASGLSKQVNRATSLRNIIKMLLYARADLDNDLSQGSIAQVDKTSLVQTCSELFEGFVSRGFLLLNATLIYSDGKVNYHARNWQPFMRHLLKFLAKQNQTIQLIMLGRIAKQVPEAENFSSLVAEHPYNISFITNPKVVEFFKSMDLLAKNDQNNDSR